MLFIGECPEKPLSRIPKCTPGCSESLIYYGHIFIFMRSHVKNFPLASLSRADIFPLKKELLLFIFILKFL